MKRDIHPVYQTCQVTCGCGHTITTRSTKPKIAVEICSHCHPFFTGKQKFVDTAGMVEKFQKKFAAASYATAKVVKVKKATKAITGKALKGTNADLALAAAPGNPKAPVSAPGMKGGILGKPGKGFDDDGGPRGRRGGPSKGVSAKPDGAAPAAGAKAAPKSDAPAPAKPPAPAEKKPDAPKS